LPAPGILDLGFCCDFCYYIGLLTFDMGIMISSFFDSRFSADFIRDIF